MIIKSVAVMFYIRIGFIILGVLFVVASVILVVKSTRKKSPNGSLLINETLEIEDDPFSSKHKPRKS